MRPRHYCRGRAPPGYGLPSGDLCFNEAAALLPREGRRCPPTRHGTVSCFNEAAALLPREGL
ncbi:hypothetical protein DF3PB_280009 [uncultured Defluviicoccus sp.]|uniref:Uncharacterized protein n=1 Tax=metagenome TaxID=256318 RepID=A0A380TFA9_9ZZZZ|nr:hypothetical protein DF3PB_280009 [uncultured Defluviicoccus sp.]